MSKNTIPAKQVRFKPTGTLVVSHMALVEIDAISYKGELFVPTGIPTSAESSDEEEEEDEKPVKAAPVKKAAKPVVDEEEEEEEEKPAAKAAKKVGGDKPSDKEMEKMDIEELWDMVDEIPGLRKKITAADGKNTNKKVRTALLEAWGTGGKSSKEEEDDDAPATTGRGRGAVAETTGSFPKGADKVLKKFDTGELDAAEAATELVELGADKAAAKKFIAEFSADTTAPVEKYVKKLPSLFTETEEEEEEEEAPVKKAPAKGGAKVIPHDELEVGDLVTVQWEDGEKYDGEVASIGKKGITIDYTDDTSDLLDEEMVVYARK